jgi:hypothetical protein
MNFSNPARQAKENAAAYVKSLMDLLGDRDPFEVQSQSLASLQAEIAGLDEATLRRPESVWKMVQMIAAHDLLHLNQIRRIKKAHGSA